MRIQVDSDRSIDSVRLNATLDFNLSESEGPDRV